MPVVAFSSPKGGVGKTTLAANVAVAMHQLGWGVVAMDFDVQNSLRLHFGMALSDGRGYVAAQDRPEDWPNMALQTPSGVFILPYGKASDQERLQFESHLIHDEDYLRRGLGPILDRDDWVVIADLAPGPVPALQALGRVGALQVAVLLADATSLSLLPVIEQGRFYGDTRPLVVVNQVDPRRRLSRTVTDFVAERIPDHLLGQVYRDEGAAEAIGWQRSVFEHAPNGVAARDIRAIAERLSARLKPAPVESEAREEEPSAQPEPQNGGRRWP
ncbi:MAG: cellulose synthase operon protein YhjQ/BcsQ [Zavarzinia sp.]|nr:cellulose synthase operon protein YhjQ/BcsQ [Zavarzinia sp.]